MNGNFFPLLRIIERLRGLCESKKTGTFFIKTQQNKLSCFVLMSGDIVSVRHGSAAGELCITSIAKIDRALFSFKEGETILHKPMMLPGNEAILDDLIIQHHGHFSTEAATPPIPVAMMDKSDRDKMEAVLMDVLGPIAELYIDQLGSYRTIDEVLSMLAIDLANADLLKQIRSGLNL